MLLIVECFGELQSQNIAWIKPKLEQHEPIDVYCRSNSSKFIYKCYISSIFFCSLFLNDYCV